VPLPVAGERLAQPPSPENCTIREESRTTVRVSCAESEYFDANTATYVLQVFDADTRRLLASATSLTPSMLEVTDLPAERSQSGLVLSLRIMTAHAMSDATVLHSPHFVQESNTQEHQQFPGTAHTPQWNASCPFRSPINVVPLLLQRRWSILLSGRDHREGRAFATIDLRRSCLFKFAFRVTRPVPYEDECRSRNRRVIAIRSRSGYPLLQRPFTRIAPVSELSANSRPIGVSEIRE